MAGLLLHCEEKDIPMESIFGFLSSQMEWVQDKVRFDLLAGVHIVAVLQVEGVFSHKAVSECSEMTCQLMTSGMLKSNIEVVDFGTHARLAEFKKNLLNSNGKISMTNGQEYLLTHNPLMTEYRLMMDQDEIIKMEISPEAGSTNGRVMFGGEAARVNDLPVLVPLLEYVAMTQRINASVTADYN
jgi:hypothetical protein